VPLLLTYPETDIPVVQLSVQSRLGPAHHFDLGRALAPLRDDILILGSGSFTHNLHEYFGGAEDGTEPEWVSRFTDWFDRALAEGRTQDLLDYRRLAPAARRNHPTEEHLLPLFVALGAAGPRPHVERLHRSADRGVLRLDAYTFGEAAQARTGRPLPGAETRERPFSGP
jgi:4,5-DOPA dioxygenase extradiol